LPLQNPVYFGHSTEKLKMNYISEKELSLDEGMLAWWGHLHFHVYIPEKITKHRIMVYIVCESVPGCICTMKIYDGKCETLMTQWGFC
jgi:hypothetical protein